MNRVAMVCRYLVTYAEPSLSDLTDEHLALAPTGEGKTAGWILGHLCVTGDYIRRKCGQPPLTPRAWGPMFAPESRPSTDRRDYPSMRELKTAFASVYRDLAAIAPDVSAELLAVENPLEYTRSRFPTFGEFLVYIMTGHLGYHLGQLSGWRAAAGMSLRPGATSPL